MLIRESDSWHDDTVVVFNHVPKVGGNSIFRLFERIFGEERTFKHRIRFPAPDGRRRVIDDLSDDELRRLRFVGGHFEFGNAERFRRLGLGAVYIGVIRRPVERFRSSYLYNRRSGRPDVKEKYQSRSFEDLARAILRKGESPYVTNGQISTLTGTRELEAAKETVQREYLCLCTTDQLDAMQAILAAHFGYIIEAPIRANVAPPHDEASLSAETVARIDEANRIDNEFYKWVATQFEGLKNKLIGGEVLAGSILGRYQDL